MKKSQKDLIFYFMEEIQLNDESENSLYNQQEKLLSELEEIPMNYQELQGIITRLSDMIVNLCSEMKYTYFEYGITARHVLDTTILE